MLSAATALFLGSAGRALFAAQDSGETRTVWDGVYSDAQAGRATTVFGQSCAGCHSLASEGNGPLVGDPFWRGYTQRTVGDLLNYVRANMPNGNGGSLPESSYNDLVALILKSNGFPAGATEISPETAVKVQILPRGGAGELPSNALVRVVGCLSRAGNEWVLTSAVAPERIEHIGPGPEDATRPLGTRTIALKFVLTRLDPFAGQRLSVSGMLVGAGGVNGINVATVNRVAETCP
jgi:mono/diheme cytochrome c family protein